MINAKPRKITLFQLMFFYMVSIYPASIRFIPKAALMTAHQAGWLVSACSTLPFILYLYLLYRVTKRFEGQSLHDIMRQVFGKVISKVICVIIFLWMIILTAVYLKYAGTQAVSTTYVGSDINLIIFLYILLIAVMLRWGIQPLNRMAFIIYWAGMLQFFLMLAFVLPGSFENLTPVSSLDILPILKGVPYNLAVNSYIFIFFIFNDQIEYGKKKNFRKFIYTAAFLLFACTMVAIAILTTFGYELSLDLNYPFLAAVDDITIANSSVGLVALFYASWVMYEFITIAAFIYAALRLLKDIFNLKSQTPALTATAGLCFFFSIYFSNDSFDLEAFSYTIAYSGVLLLFVTIPVALFITAKARKMLPPCPKRPRKKQAARQPAIQP